MGIYYAALLLATGGQTFDVVEQHVPSSRETLNFMQQVAQLHQRY